MDPYDETVRLLLDAVAIEPDEFPTERGELVIPEAYAERPEHRFWRGVVMAVGPGNYNRHGRRILPDVQVGDRVLYDRNVSQPIVNGWTVVPEEAILLAGDAVDEFTHVAKTGLRVDGTRV